jgi:hypothetical protein
MDEEREPIPLNPSNEAFRQLTPYFGGMCCEAAAYCFSKNGHRIPTSTALTGCDPSRAAFEWTVPPAEADATYRDRDVAAENGAYALAIALLHRLHGYRVIERSAKGTGFDFWLGRASGGLPFNNRTRLEVSGIFSGTSRVSLRLKRKLAQMAPSDNSGKGVAVVAEFGGPTVAVAAKEASDGR